MFTAPAARTLDVEAVLFDETSGAARSSGTVGDSISSLAWYGEDYGAASWLLSASWDGAGRLWEVQHDTCQPLLRHVLLPSNPKSPPLLTCAWGSENRAFTGGADGVAKCWSIQTGQAVQVAAHEQPIRSLRWCESSGSEGLLMTASLDQTLKFWDLRMPSNEPANTLSLPNRPTAASVCKRVLAVSVFSRPASVLIYDLNNLSTPYVKRETPHNHPITSISLFPDATGFIGGSIEGRCAVHHVAESDKSKNFVFKCHRSTTHIFPVNDITFHKRLGTFATCGSDGSFVFWDKDSRMRLKQSEQSPAPLTACQLNQTGNLLAYAIGYDWASGPTALESHKTKVFIHKTKPEEINPKPKKF